MGFGMGNDTIYLCPGDVDICARTIWGEARGESMDGKRAIAHVLINRWQSVSGQFRRDDTLATACLRHLQFSAWNRGDANFEKLFTVDMTDRAFRECHEALWQALHSADDITGGATHYLVTSIADRVPWWVPEKSQIPIRRIGNHSFGKFN